MTTTSSLFNPNSSPIRKETETKEHSINRSKNVLTGLAQQILSGLLLGAQKAGSVWGGATAFKCAIKNNPIQLKTKKVALEKMGIGGSALAVLLHSIIEPAIKNLLDDPKGDSEIKKLLSTMPELKDAVETILTTAVANLAGKAYRGRQAESSDEMLNNILLYIAELMEPHLSGNQSIFTEIEKLEMAETTANEKEKKNCTGAALEKIQAKNKDLKRVGMAKAFTPLVNDIIKAALPEGLHSAGLNTHYFPSFILKFIQDYLVSFGTYAAADWYIENMEPIQSYQQRRKELSGTEEGQLLNEAIDKGANAIFDLHPLLKKFKGLGKHLSNVLVTKIVLNLATDKKQPLQSALAHLQSILLKFYKILVENREYVLRSYQERQKLRQALAVARKDTDPKEIHAREEYVAKLERQLSENIKEGQLLFTNVTIDLWESTGIEKDPLLKFILKQMDLTPEKLSKIILTQFDDHFLSNPALQKWIFPEASMEQTKKEIAQHDLGSAVNPIIHAISHLITVPAQKLIKQEKDSISSGLVAILRSFLPYLSSGVRDYVKKGISQKLEGISSSPVDKDPLWQFLEGNIEATALDILKSFSDNPQQANFIKAISALTSGGKAQNVLSSVEGIWANLRTLIQRFAKEHGDVIEKTRPELMAAKAALDTMQASQQKLKSAYDKEGDVKAFLAFSEKEYPVSKQLDIVKSLETKFYGQFEQLLNALLLQTGLTSLFDKDSRLSVFGLNKIVYQQLLVATEALYKQITFPNKAPQLAADATMDPKELTELVTHVVSIADKHMSGTGPKRNSSYLERIADVEMSASDESTKKREIADIFRPLIEELSKDKQVLSRIILIVTKLISANAPAELQHMFGAATSALGNELTSMLPMMLAHVYPLLIGSFSGAEARKLMLRESDEGEIIVAGIAKGTQSLVGPILSNLLSTLTHSPKDTFKGSPLLKSLESFGVLLSDSILTDLCLKLAEKDLNHPLKSIISRLQELLGTVYGNHGLQIKNVYKEYLYLKQRNASISVPLDPSQTLKINLELKEKELERERLLANALNVLWTETGITNTPPLSLMPDFAKNAIPASLRGVLDTLIEQQPGILNWIHPESDNGEVRQNLGFTPEGNTCIALSDTIAFLGTAPLSGVVASNKNAIAQAALKAAQGFLPMTPEMEKAFQNVVGSKLEEISSLGLQDPIWQFVHSNLEGVALEFFSSMITGDPKQTALGKGLMYVALGSQKTDGFNPIEAIAENFLDIISEFHEKYKNVEPKNFQPLVDALLKATGLERMLSPESRLGIFGLDKILREQLLKLCAMMYEQGMQPEKGKAGISHNLGISLFAPQHALRIASGESDKATRLKKVGIQLDASSDVARQKEILDASDATATAKFVNLGNEFLAKVIEDQIQKYLTTNGKSIATILNNDVFHKRLQKDKDLQVIGDAIQKLAHADAKGTRALFDYLHHVLTPALSKGMSNIFKSTPEAVKIDAGAHDKQMLPMNVLTHLLETLNVERTAIESTPAFKQLLKSIRETEAKIVKTPTDAFKHELETLQGKLAELYQPLSKKLLSMIAANSAKVSDPAHPLQDLHLLPESLRQTIWDTLLTNCLNQCIATHYLTMTPRTESLEEQLNKNSGNNVMTEFCRVLSIVIRDSTPQSLVVDPKTLSSNLYGTIEDMLKRAKNPPAFVHKFLEIFKTNESTVIQIVASFFNALGASQLAAFKDQLWPALQQISFPVLLQLFNKLTIKLQEVDKPKIRTQLAIDLMEMFSTHGRISNAAAVAKKQLHVHEVPTAEMFEQFKIEGKLHPVIEEVLKHPEQEHAIRKKYFSDYTKKLFELIGFTKEDLPLVENQAAFDLLINELAPLALGISFDCLLPGKTSGPIESNMYNNLIINMLDLYKVNAKQAKDKGLAEEAIKALPADVLKYFPGSFRNMNILPGIDMSKALQQPQYQDIQQKKLEHFCGLILNELKARIPDSIAHKKFIKAIQDASAKDLAVSLRTMCEEGSLIKLMVWLTKITTPNLVAGEFDENGNYKLKEVTPVFHAPKPLPPNAFADGKQEATKQLTSAGSDIIAESIVYWFNSIIDSIAGAFNLGLADIYRKIDKFSISKHASLAISKGVKDMVWWVCWGLFVLTVVPVIIFAISKYFYIPRRVKYNVEHIYNDVFAPHVRNAGYQIADRLIAK